MDGVGRPARWDRGTALWSAQAGMWFAQQVAADGRVYRMGQYVDIPGQIDAALLDRATRTMLREIDTMRTRFVEYDGEVRQLVDDDPEWTLKVLDLSGEPAPERAAHEWMRANLAAPVDLGRAPLFDSALLRLGPGRTLWFQAVHHIVTDAFSCALLIQRIVEVYEALATGGSVPLREYAGPAVYLAEDEAYHGSPDFARDREFWLAKLADRPDPTSLSHQVLARDHGTVRGHAVLPEEDAARLHAAAASMRAGWQAVLVAAGAAYTHRLTGAEDLLLGLPLHARTSEVLRRSPANWSNVLPLRVDVRPGLTVRELVRHVSVEMRQLLRHQRYRYQNLRRDLGLLDDAAMYGLEINLITGTDQLDFAGYCATVHNVSIGPVEDLAVVARNAPDGGEIRFDWNGNARRYDADDVQAHQRRFATFLRTVSEDPERRVGDLAVLDESERRQVVHHWAGLRRDIPDRTVQELFAEQVSRTPHATAVDDGETRLTYAKLDARVNRLAHALIELGAAPERAVVSTVPRSTDAVVALLAVLKAGAVYVPVDLTQPVERVATVLRTVRPTIVLGRGGAPDADLPWFAIDTLDGRPGTDPAVEPTSAPIADGLAYVIFTSGSTGEPKGAMVHHRGMVNHLLAKIEDLGLSSADVLALNAPLTFDVSVWQMLSVLLVGGRVQVVSDEAARDALTLFEEVSAAGITVLEVVPSVLRAAIEAWDSGMPQPGMPTLRWFVVNGEVLSPELCRRWYRRLPNAAIINAYGLTECSDDNTHAFITPDGVHGDGRLPVGRPLRNNNVYLLGHDMRPVPAGVPGELFIAGVGVGRGYFRDPARTAERYVPDPYAGVPGARMYRTGDRARYRPDGQLDFLGRRDHQVKIRGNRIELGDVEAALRSVPGVTGAVVVVHGTGTVRRLVGYVVAERDPGDVRAIVATRLPEYMVPAAVLVLDEFPLTTNGKINRRALPEPRFPTGAAGSEPETPHETALCELFGAVLGLDTFGADDDFFQHGGDSIVVIQLVSRARQRGLGFTARDVFQHSTPATLAKVARAAEPGRTTSPDAGLGQVVATPIMEWLRQVPGPTDGFSQSVLVRTPDRINPAHLVAAVQSVLDHHDALRARLVEGDESWTLDVPARGAVNAEQCVRRAEGSDVDAERAAAQRELAPRDGDMVRVVWFEGEPGEILAVVHHLVVDGVSWRVLLPDLEAAYVAIAAGEQPEPASTGTSLREWAAGLRATADERMVELPFWRAVTADVAAVEPMDPRRDVLGAAATLTVEAPPEVARPLLTDVVAAYHATPDDVLLAALALAVRQWRGAGPVLVDLEGHGREDIDPDIDLSRTVGWFTSMYPVRLDAGDAAPGAALKRIKEQLRQVPGNGIGYGLLRYVHPAGRAELSSAPVPEFGLNYLGRVAVATTGSWQPVEVRGGGDDDMPLAHRCEIDALVTADGALRTTFTWPPALLSETETRELADAWLRALSSLVADAAGGFTPSDMPLIALSQDDIDDLELAIEGGGR